MVKLRKIKDIMVSTLILFPSVFLSCVFLSGAFKTQIQIHKLSEMNGNVEIRLKYGSSTQKHTGKKSVYFIV